MRAGLPHKRQAIIEAARRVFLRNGFTDTSVDVVAAEAGVSKQTVYNHFGDKASLFKAVIAATQQSGPDEVALGFLGAIAESDNLEQHLRVLGRGLVVGVLREDVAALRRLVIAEWGRHPELLDAWAAPRPMIEGALSRMIERQVERGTLDVDDAPLAVRQLMTLVATEALSRSLYGARQLSDDTVNQIVDDGVTMWLRAYRARPDHS